MDTESISLRDNLCVDAVVIPTDVVGKMIDEANEAQLKIYLYLLRMGRSGSATVSEIADYFNYTESDVKRALKFWNKPTKKKQIEQAEDSKTDIIDRQNESKVQGDNVVNFSGRPHYSKEKIAEFASIPEVTQLLYAAEQYIGRPLKPDDINYMFYLYDEMGFAPELIEYLIEYCISNGNTSLRGMEMIASQWKETGVTDLASAKRLTRQVPSQMKDVFAALGMDVNQQPVDAQIMYVRKWTESYGYDMDIIKIACDRTILAIAKPSFKYVNGIIKNWHDQGVKTIADILRVDEEYKGKKVDESFGMTDKKMGNVVKKSSTASDAKKSKFSNFNEREYDYASLMKDIMSN